MTLEEENARLREELALERTKAHELSSALASAVASAARVQIIDAERKAARSVQNRKAYERRQHSIQHAEGGADARAESLPPPLDGSPPPSVPSSPSPLSSPPSLFPLPSSAAPREELKQALLVGTGPTQKPKKKRVKIFEKPPDPRHAPLTRELCEIHGWPHHGGRTAKAVLKLLELADQVAGVPGSAEAVWEVTRRAAIARSSDGYPRVRELHELAERWGHFAEAPRGQGPPRADPNAGIVRDTASGCAGCGAEGETANVGEPEARFGYSCGCIAAWYETRLNFTEAAAWAERRRRGSEGEHEGADRVGG